MSHVVYHLLDHLVISQEEAISNKIHQYLTVFNCMFGVVIFSVVQELINDVAHEIFEFFINEMPTKYFQFGRRRVESVQIQGNVSIKRKGKLFDKVQYELFRRRKLSF